MLAGVAVGCAGACWLAAGVGMSATGSKFAAGCTSVARPKAATRTAPKPTAALSPAKTYYVTLRTNCGNFTVKVDPKTSPNAAASFVSLAKHGFYDGTPIFEIKKGTFFAGGDPTGTGKGGPGYTTVDKVPPDAKYMFGAVLMEKPSGRPSGTAGSQFVVVASDDANLSPVYAAVGSVYAGPGVINLIALLGNSFQEPSQVIVVEKATVSTG